MNHTPSGSLILSKAIPFFLNYKTAEGLSARTIDSYERTLSKWLAYQGDDEISAITKQEITAYLSWLHTDYVPKRFNGKNHPLSPKTLRNIWVTLSSFYSWAKLEFEIPNPMESILAPRFKINPVEPFKQDEVETMLKVCLHSREVHPGNRRNFFMRLANGTRGQAILLVLLDTGVRATELYSLTVNDVDLKTGKVTVRHGVGGGAKDGKGRCLAYSRM